MERTTAFWTPGFKTAFIGSSLMTLFGLVPLFISRGEAGLWIIDLGAGVIAMLGSFQLRRTAARAEKFLWGTLALLATLLYLAHYLLAFFFVPYAGFPAAAYFVLAGLSAGVIALVGVVRLWRAH